MGINVSARLISNTVGFGMSIIYPSYTTSESAGLLAQYKEKVRVITIVGNLFARLDPFLIICLETGDLTIRDDDFPDYGSIRALEEVSDTFLLGSPLQVGTKRIPSNKALLSLWFINYTRKRSPDLLPRYGVD